MRKQREMCDRTLLTETYPDFGQDVLTVQIFAEIAL